MSVLTSLKALRDVDGVLGSFVLDSEGSLLARDLSQVFDSELLCDVGPRIRRMADGLAESGEVPGSVLLHFKDHKLWLRTIESYMLCVLGVPQVNRPALRMALTLVSRRVAPLLASEQAALESVPPPIPASIPSSHSGPDTLISAPAHLLSPHSAPAVTLAPTPPPAPVSSAAPVKKAMWRGRPIDD
ncbi:MAG TPA: roadblock/LC7 domain-containing protein [Polyangiaceae bacterium]|jgi:predicted regulator of Ras-like GTPase activity (Roadblock/LC7/MglB family)|nr:roadblock/LC7 domain-containing protein [Polyangiaceae bacterium]